GSPALRHVGDRAEELAPDRGQALEDPAAEPQQRPAEREHLGDEREGGLADLGGGLDDAHDEAHGRADEQERRGAFDRDPGGAVHHVEDGVGGHRKLRARLPMMRPQPSTRTNTMTLTGRLTRAGGNIIMPMAIKTLETTTSMTRKGTSTRKPISNAVRTSDSTNAGTSTTKSTSDRVAGRGRSEMS